MALANQIPMLKSHDIFESLEVHPWPLASTAPCPSRGRTPPVWARWIPTSNDPRAPRRATYPGPSGAVLKNDEVLRLEDRYL